MTKEELHLKIAQRTGQKKSDAEKTLAAFMAVCSEALQHGDDIQLRGFGLFSVKERAARRGRNPNTGEEIVIAPRKGVVFKASRQLLGGGEKS